MARVVGRRTFLLPVVGPLALSPLPSDSGWSRVCKTQRSGSLNCFGLPRGTPPGGSAGKESGLQCGNLRDRIQRRKKELQNLSTPQSLFQLALPWLLPFLGPLLLIILLLLLGPCFFNLFQRFLQDRIWAIFQQQVKTILESLTSTPENGDPGP